MFGIDRERKQSDSVYQEFIRQHWGVLVEHNFVESHGGDFWDDDSPESIRDGCVHSFELQLHGLLCSVGEINSEIFLELYKVENVIIQFWFSDLLLLEF